MVVGSDFLTVELIWGGAVFKTSSSAAAMELGAPVPLKKDNQWTLINVSKGALVTFGCCWPKEPL